METSAEAERPTEIPIPTARPKRKKKKKKQEEEERYSIVFSVHEKLLHGLCLIDDIITGADGAV